MELDTAIRTQQAQERRAMDIALAVTGRLWEDSTHPLHRGVKEQQDNTVQLKSL